MKQMTKFFALAIVMIAFSAVTFAQVSASATAVAEATIIAPITITNTAPLNFGNVIGTVAGGTVTMPVTGPPRTASDPALIANVSVVPTAASFTVNGNDGATYAIVIPVVASTLSNGTQTMSVNAWTSSPTVAAGGLLTGGTQTLIVGATLTVGANQAAGLYTSTLGTGDFQVTVNYN